MGYPDDKERRAAARAIGSRGRGDPHGETGNGSRWRAIRIPGIARESKLGHMSGERKAWLRLLERDEIAQLRQRIEAKGAKANGDDDESPAHALQRLRRVAKRLKINTDGARLDDIRIHDLRRTMGSWQARTGASLAIIGKSLGHKSQQATAVYARLDLDPDPRSHGNSDRRDVAGSEAATGGRCAPDEETRLEKSEDQCRA